MRRIYIFITMSIYGISGQPKYLENKVRFLLSEGFDVFVFSAFKSKKSMLRMNFGSSSFNNLFPALMYPPRCFKKNEINNILKSMIDTIGCNPADRVYVESNAIASAEWGEILVREVGGKHILFNLAEGYNYSEEEIGFLRFKFNRKELSGIAKMSVLNMLKDSSIQYEDWMRIAAYCNNVVADCEDKFSAMLWNDANLTFGSIGRLQKSCVLPMLRGVIDYCASKGGKYNIVMIGGGKRVYIKKIKNLVSHFHNINLIITDYIYPIPRSLLQNIDIFVSTAGSANVSFYEKRPTIKVHPFTGEPVGIMGYTFIRGKSSMFDSSNLSLVEAIMQVIEEKEKIVYDKNYIESYNNRMKTEFQRQLSFFENSNPLEYYDTINIHQKKSAKSVLFYIMGKTLGSEKMQAIVNTVKSFM